MPQSKNRQGFCLKPLKNYLEVQSGRYFLIWVCDLITNLDLQKNKEQSNAWGSEGNVGERSEW
jgi:hypothetical protein